MKKILRMRRTMALVLTASLLCSFNSSYQCDPEALLDKNIKAMKGYKFIKSFPVDIEKNGEKSEQSYVLSNNTSYRIVVARHEDNNTAMVVNVLDPDRKLLASNYNKGTKETTYTIEFLCPATGVYYIESYFLKEGKGCGLNILGYKKN